MQTLVLAWCYRQELEVLASNLMKLQEGLSPEDKCDKDQGYYGCHFNVLIGKFCPDQ